MYAQMLSSLVLGGPVMIAGSIIALALYIFIVYYVATKKTFYSLLIHNPIGLMHVALVLS